MDKFTFTYLKKVPGTSSTVRTGEPGVPIKCTFASPPKSFGDGQQELPTL